MQQPWSRPDLTAYIYITPSEKEKKELMVCLSAHLFIALVLISHCGNWSAFWVPKSLFHIVFILIECGFPNFSFVSKLACRCRQHILVFQPSKPHVLGVSIYFVNIPKQKACWVKILANHILCWNTMWAHVHSVVSLDISEQIEITCVENRSWRGKSPAWPPIAHKWLRGPRSWCREMFDSVAS